MCGIVGYLSARVPIESSALERMRDTLTHRGPDGHGIWLSEAGNVALGHRRLSIVDLSDSGSQPMSSPDDRLQIVFNGEIYNHHKLRDELRNEGWKFTGSSDTEVLLAAYARWGEGALERLSGMFAFAIWDRQTGKLFAARDRAGEKPFFYRLAGGTLLFASELKAIFAYPGVSRTIDPIALDHFLAYGYAPRELCLVAGCRKLPAGHKLRYDLASGKAEVEPYWQLPRFAPGDSRADFSTLVEEFEPLFERSVRRQLLADVPVGILLSGGLDSSLVAEAAARVSGKVTTFTIGFPNSAQFDESPIARRLAAELGTEHHELMAEPGTIDLLPKMARQFDEPIADSSMIPTFLVSELVRGQATVALGGDGGDELFGGYLQHNWARRIAVLRRGGLHHLGLAGHMGRLLPYDFPGRKMILRLLDPADAAITVSRLAEPGQRKALIGSDRYSCPRAAEDYRESLLKRWEGPSERAMAHDFLTYMCDDVLVKVDRASMLTSLEVRAPLLDKDIIEFAFGRLAPEQRASAEGRKLLLRQVARKRLPKWFDVKRKQGFSIPLAAWMRGPWASLLSDLAESAGDGLLRPEGVRDFLRTGTGSNRLAHQVFQFAMFEMWRREYRVSWG